MIGRFINADSYASTGQGFLGYNMFAYCGNNPTIFIDQAGKRMNLTVNTMTTDSGFAGKRHRKNMELLSAVVAVSVTMLSVRKLESGEFTIDASISYSVAERLSECDYSSVLYSQLLAEKTRRVSQQDSAHQYCLMDEDHIFQELNAHFIGKDVGILLHSDSILNSCEVIDLNIDESRPLVKAAMFFIGVFS